MNPKAYMEEAERSDTESFGKSMRSIAYDNLLRVWVEKVEIPLKQFLQNHTRWKLL